MSVLKKMFLISVLLLFTAGLSFAATYTISGYRFEINGKTREETVRNLIVSKSVEQYSSEEEVKQALENKRHTLINSRLFYEDEIYCHYDIEPAGGDNYNVFVSYVVSDANSTLLLPYPQYDSNTGLILGLRYKDKNFMGLGKELSIVFDAEQYENSYEKGEFYLEVPVEEFKLGDTSYSGSFEANLNLHDKSRDYVALEIAEKNFHLGNVSLPAHFMVDYNYDSKKLREIGYGVAVNNIHLTDNIRLNLSNNMLLSWKTVSDTYLNLQATLSNIKLGNSTLSSRTYMKFKNKTKDLKDGIKKEKIEEGLSLTFKGDLKMWSLSSLLSYNFYPNSKRGDLFKTDSLVNYKFNSVYTGSIGIITKRYEHGGLYSVDPYEKITVRSKIAGEIPFVFSFSGHNDIILDDEKVDFFFSSSLSSNYGNINYTENFRKGTTFSIFGKLDYHPWKEKKADKTEYKFKVNFTSFPFALSWFNPSLRITLLASSKNYYWYDDSGWRLEADDVQSLFRGIQTKSKYVQQAYKSSKLVAAMNVNLVSTMFIFEDFGKTYLNFFVDTGVIRADKIYKDKDNKYKDYKWLTGAGVEVVAIMDSHPSYPIRISFGVDTESFKNKFISKKDGASLDYEIYIGLGWMY